MSVAEVDEENRRLVASVSVVVGVIAIILIGLSNNPEWVGSFFGWLLTWGEVIAGIGSLVLTGALVVLYYRMAENQGAQVRTMQSQADTMRRELDWLSGQQTPDIWITDFSQYSGDLPRIAGNNDHILVKLNNYGSGPARNLYQRCDVWVMNEERLTPVQSMEFSVDGWNFGLKPGKWNLAPPPSFDRTISNVGIQFRQRTQGGLLPEKEENWYYSQVNLMLDPENDNGHSISFQDAMLLLWAADIETVMYQISLLYRDPAGNIQGKPILSGQHQLDDGFTLENFAPHGGFSGSIGMIIEKVREEEDLPPYQ